MADQVRKLYSNEHFAIWHIPQANAYVYEGAGVAIDDSNYHDSPIEDSYEDAVDAACELYDFDKAAMVNTLPAVYSNALFQVYKTPDNEFIYRFCEGDNLDEPTDKDFAEHEGEFYATQQEAVIAAFEEDLSLRTV
jgi:hypothetical protein